MSNLIEIKRQLAESCYLKLYMDVEYMENYESEDEPWDINYVSWTMEGFKELVINDTFAITDVFLIFYSRCWRIEVVVRFLSLQDDGGRVVDTFYDFPLPVWSSLSLTKIKGFSDAIDSAFETIQRLHYDTSSAKLQVGVVANKDVIERACVILDVHWSTTSFGECCRCHGFTICKIRPCEHAFLCINCSIECHSLRKQCTCPACGAPIQLLVDTRREDAEQEAQERNEAEWEAIEEAERLGGLTDSIATDSFVSDDSSDSYSLTSIEDEEVTE